MRYVYFLLIVLLMASCAQGRLRLRKVDKTDRSELVEVTPKKERSFASKLHQEIVEAKNTKTSVEVALNPEETTIAPKTSTVDDPTTESFDAEETATVVVEEDPSNQQKVKQALIAEQDARQARNSFIWSLVMLFLFFIPFVPLFSIVPFVVGSIKLNQSNKSDYITLEGERDARIARIMQLIYGVLVGLSLLLVAILLIVLLL
ncbi:MAG: hypothetical protein ACFHU9_12670 [Fluviicola sp.]